MQGRSTNHVDEISQDYTQHEKDIHTVLRLNLQSYTRSFYFDTHFKIWEKISVLSCNSIPRYHLARLRKHASDPKILENYQIVLLLFQKLD